MKVRIKDLVYPRAEQFGGVIYVHRRNDFFFADAASFGLIAKLSRNWIELPDQARAIYTKLASLGVCDIEGTDKEEGNYSGPSFIGEFEDIPKVKQPLVLNCFATAHCPLMCRYCHADDLMKPFRDNETEAHLDAVIESARRIDALVAVITGGDPITRVDRTMRLIEGIAPMKPIVLDTSGVPNSRQDFERLLPILVDRGVHVRVSIDGFAREHDKARPINRRYINYTHSAHEQATATTRELLRSGVPITIQTVLSNINDQVDNLVQFAQTLDSWGIRHWVLHVALAAGRARGMAGRSVLPTVAIVSVIIKVLKEIQKLNLRLDVRVTNANPIPYAVFLLGSEGDLFTEGLAKAGKTRSFHAAEIVPGMDVWKDVDSKAHTARYANWIKDLYPGKNLSELTIKLQGESLAAPAVARKIQSSIL